MSFRCGAQGTGWVQAALSIEGKLANLDITYAGSYLKRENEVRLEYSDYSYFYDALPQYGYTLPDDFGNVIDPTQRIRGKDHYARQSHEIRIATPQDARLRFIAGFFF